MRNAWHYIRRGLFIEALFGRRRPRVRGAKPGPAMPPETFVPKAIHVFHYTPETMEETEVEFAEDLAAYRGRGGVTWVNVNGLGNVDLIREIGRVFSLHPLAVEDVHSLRQSSKVDRYPEQLYVVIKQLHYEEELWTEQVSLFLGSDFVLTFQERPGDCLEPIRERLRTGKGQVRREGADFLMYAIIDAFVDDYFPFLERVGAVVEDLEDEAVTKPSRRTVGRIHEVKRDLFHVRRVVWPLRESLNALLRDETPLVGKTAHVYLRDVYDHAVLILDIVETYRELVGGLTDVYLSSINIKMQEVMKVLTVIATIFMPLSFIASVYGMNFVYLPEKDWHYGYAFAWGIMILIAGAMTVYFWRKGWFRSNDDGR